MENFFLHKKPVFKMFIIQYGQILGLEFGLIISDIFLELDFIVFQLLLVPIFILLLFAKYNKTVTTIFIDVKNEFISLDLNFYLLFNQNYKISFDNVIFKYKWKWLLNYYSQVIEIWDANKLVVVIPFKGSIWNKSELTNLSQALKKISQKK